jgi:hypothetical protein
MRPFAAFRQGIEYGKICAPRRLAIFVSNLKEHKLENNSRATGGFVAAFFCGLLQSRGWNCAPTGRLLSTAPAALNFPANRS